MTEAAKLRAAEDPDFPAESYCVRIGDEIEWVDINIVYDRHDSTKGNSNPKSHNGNQKQPAPSNNSSQRWSGYLKSKAPIIGLPNRIDNSGYLGHSARRPINGLIFPKKPTASASDPGSPKVSCFGKVRSERDRDLHRRQGEIDSPPADEEERGGCFASFAGFLGCGGEDQAKVEEASSEERPPSRVPAPAREAPVGLGGMKRLESGRRSESWGEDAEFEAGIGGHVAWSGPLDREGPSDRRLVHV